MNKKIKKEIDNFTKLMRGIDDNLSTSILTDLIGHLSEIKEDENGKKKIDFSNFDKNVTNIKALILAISINNIEGINNIKKTDIFRDSIKRDLECSEQVKNECEISIRELSWVQELLNKENKEDEKNA